MAKISTKYLLFTIFIVNTIKSVKGIECYQCNTTTTLECSDGFLYLDNTLTTTTSCDHVYGAQYCIKMTGETGLKRYCSSLDLGNQCIYVQQPGDKLEYQTCIYTCNTDWCNGASSIHIPTILFVALLFISKCTVF